MEAGNVLTSAESTIDHWAAVTSHNESRMKVKMVDIHSDFGIVRFVRDIAC